MQIKGRIDIRINGEVATTLPKTRLLTLIGNRGG